MNLVVKQIAILGAIVAGITVGWTRAASVLPNSPEAESVGKENYANISPEAETVARETRANITPEIKQEESAIAQHHSDPKIPTFTGEIGHYEASQSFTDFIFDNQANIVFIDAYYVPESWDEIEIINNSFGVDYFHLWHHCLDESEVSEVPSVRNCTGTSFSLVRDAAPKDADFTFVRGTVRIQGYFAIRGCGGPHQGSMGCTLRPLNPEDV
ncbi:MAG: hypothetical protein SAJ12_01010 [Jaaginema sp. PMC 1079.18]|nr:hypothetical protein [Jaaginema sp. PMC 1080.18]MEC4849564.1 hypothetical protein [Jaaginema sp. PMC 1079.18]MEC4868641.1 hypothetical protein [Jaaginema sp. PMC 1078.18]